MRGERLRVVAVHAANHGANVRSPGDPALARGPAQSTSSERAGGRDSLRLGDEYLPLREAAKVDAIAGWTSVMVSADKVDALLKKNTALLGASLSCPPLGRA